MIFYRPRQNLQRFQTIVQRNTTQSQSKITRYTVDLECPQGLHFQRAVLVHRRTEIKEVLEGEVLILLRAEDAEESVSEWIELQLRKQFHHFSDMEAMVHVHFHLLPAQFRELFQYPIDG